MTTFGRHNDDFRTTSGRLSDDFSTTFQRPPDALLTVPIVRARKYQQMLTNADNCVESLWDITKYDEKPSAAVLRQGTLHRADIAAAEQADMDQQRIQVVEVSAFFEKTGPNWAVLIVTAEKGIAEGIEQG